MIFHKEKQLNNKLLDEKCIKNIKSLSMDIISSFKNSDYSLDLAVADVMYVLFCKHIIYDRENSNWINRDRFILSSNSLLPILYSALYMSGYQIDIKDLKQNNFFNNSNLIPSFVTTFPSYPGYGLGISVGMALAEYCLHNRYLYKKNKSLIDHYTYVICEEEEFLTGISYEAKTIASNLELNKLIVMFTAKKDTNIDEIINEFKAVSWNIKEIGNDIENIDYALKECKKVTNNRPSIIIIKEKELLTSNNYLLLKEKYNIRNIEFAISDDCYSYMQSIILERNKIIKDWYKNYDRIFSNIKLSFQEELNKLVSGQLAIKWKEEYLSNDDFINLEDVCSNILDNIVNNNELIFNEKIEILSPLNNNYINNKDVFHNKDQATGAIINGLTLCLMRSFKILDISLIDNVKTAINMARELSIPVTYIIYYDDSNIEKLKEEIQYFKFLANINIYFPSDINELIGSFKYILEKPSLSIIFISNNKATINPNTNLNKISCGAYVVVEGSKKLDKIIIVSGEHLDLVIKITQDLNNSGYSIRLVSMPSISNFKNQKEKYREEILPSSIPKIIIDEITEFDDIEKNILITGTSTYDDIIKNIKEIL